MNYPLTSMAAAVGSILRRTGLKDTSLIPDINEWLVEAMGLLQVSLTLEPTFEDVKVNFHKGKYPCGLAELLAIEYCGTRLHLNNGVRTPEKEWVAGLEDVNDATFMTTVTQANTPSGNYIWASSAQKLSTMKWNATDWYKTDGRYILTSFDKGLITVYFNQVPTDEMGFLLMPDEANYKEALNWFLRARLIGRGVIKSTDYSEEKCDLMFEKFAGRAKENITYPSIDKAQATVDSLARLLPDLNYYDSFFTTTGREDYYGYRF